MVTERRSTAVVLHGHQQIIQVHTEQRSNRRRHENAAHRKRSKEERAPWSVPGARDCRALTCALLETELQAPSTVVLELGVAFARYLPGRLGGMSPSRRQECRKIRWLPKSVRTAQRARRRVGGGGGGCGGASHHGRLSAACARALRAGGLRRARAEAGLGLACEEVCSPCRHPAPRPAPGRRTAWAWHRVRRQRRAPH